MDTRAATQRGGAVGVAAVAASYAYAGFTQEFVVAPVTQAVVRYSPDAVVTFAITQFGSLAQTLILVGALAAVAALFAAAGAVAWLAADAVGYRGLETPVGGALAGGLGWLLAPTWEVGVVTGAAAAVALAAFAVPLPGRGAAGAPRRRVLRAAAGVAGSVGVASVLAGQRTYEAESVVRDPVATDLLETAEARSLAVPDTDPLVSRGFYEVDINVVNPSVDESSWRLAVQDGEETATYALDDLREFDTEHRFVTLRCVGDPRNGSKMDTALWTGVPVAAVLDDAGVDLGCCVMARAADGYYNEFPQEALRDGLLVFRMNGRPLPNAHGAPVRLLVPGHWGEINVKWLTELELLDREAEGYWEKRGWHGTGPVHTVAKLRHTERDGDRVSVGGHAYAGVRGVSAVEVSTDGGETWTEADLGPQLPGAHTADGEPMRETAQDAWRQWKYEFEASEPVEVVVRAVEEDGTVQPRERTDAHPRGALGWVTETV
jgi:DMSO/TMAO reductase YedYZ molybdopterin-dependent catalytic subunit